MDPLSLLLFVILIFLSMFFSASETAFTSVPMHKASVFLKEKKSWAKSLYKLKLKPERVLIAILIWNNIVNIFAASLATVIAMDIAAKVQFCSEKFSRKPLQRVMQREYRWVLLLFIRYW